MDSLTLLVIILGVIYSGFFIAVLWATLKDYKEKRALLKQIQESIDKREQLISKIQDFDNLNSDE